MGHERVGVLPKSRKWRAIVADVAESATGGPTVAAIATETLSAVRHRYEHIHEDHGVNAAFEFLVALSNAPRTDQRSAWGDLPLDLAENPSALQIARALRTWIAPRVQSREVGEIATRAATDAIVAWQSEHAQQGPLFAGNDAGIIWSKAASGAGFSEVARLFFSSFTERYLKYFLDREASSVLPSIADREAFSRSLSEHVDAVTRHAFDTAKITQSFAAGWYNKHAHGERPSARRVESFLRVAFAKLREELAREARAQ